jgi:hypothetical protein
VLLRHGSQAGSHDAVDLCAPQRPDEIERIHAMLGATGPAAAEILRRNHASG